MVYKSLLFILIDKQNLFMNLMDTEKIFFWCEEEKYFFRHTQRFNKKNIDFMWLQNNDCFIPPADILCMLYIYYYFLQLKNFTNSDGA